MSCCGRILVSETYVLHSLRAMEDKCADIIFCHIYVLLAESMIHT
jgi:hypothetical protein